MMTLENSLCNVALLNTKGIHAMVMERKNAVPKALHDFKKALEDLEQIRSCPPPASLDHHDDNGESSFIDAFHSSPIAPQSFQQESTSTAIMSGSGFFVYNRAVGFKPLSDTSNVGLTFYTAILQFNMALAHHVKAVSSAKNPTVKKSHAKSLKYYKMCLRSLKEIGVSGGTMADRPPYPGGGEAMIFLRLATLNNMAHVYTLQEEYQRVEETLARVFKFTVAQRPTLFASCEEEATEPESSSSLPPLDHHAADGQQHEQEQLDQMDDCSSSNNNTARQAAAEPRNTFNSGSSLMNSSVVNEVLLNVMVSTGGPSVIGAGAA